MIHSGRIHQPLIRFHDAEAAVRDGPYLIKISTIGNTRCAFRDSTSPKLDPKPDIRVMSLLTAKAHRGAGGIPQRGLRGRAPKITS